ncbi:MAG TPA: head GIN domain-containing protein [Pedobacter sp.]|jgi:hypothetical protein
MKTLQAVLIVITIVMFSSCSKERLEGNGQIVTEVRTLKNFSGVINSGSKHIHVKHGSGFKVELRGSSNLIPAYHTEIINGNLNLKYENVNVRNDDLEVYVTMPAIRRADLTGSGKISINGSFPAQDYCEATVSGSGDIQVDGAFDVDELDVTISGSGRADLLSIKSQRTEVLISGSGEAKVNAIDHLKVKISGSGTTYYTGNPTIESEISGSGRVVRY